MINQSRISEKESAYVFFLLIRSNPSHTTLMKLHILSPSIVWKAAIKAHSNRLRKSKKLAVFFIIFGLTLAMFLTSQLYDFNAIAHIGAPLGVE